MAAIVTGVATATGRVAPRRGRYTQFSRCRVRIAAPAASAAAGRAAMPVLHRFSMPRATCSPTPPQRLRALPAWTVRRRLPPSSSDRSLHLTAQECHPCPGRTRSRPSPIAGASRCAGLRPTAIPFTSSRRACHSALERFSPTASSSRETSLHPTTSRHPPIHFCPGSASMERSSARCRAISACSRRLRRVGPSGDVRAPTDADDRQHRTAA